MPEEELVKFAAILDEFAAAQRRQALDQARKERITITRPIGNAHAQVELVVDEHTSSQDIWQLIAPIESALERLNAKNQMETWLESALADARTIDVGQGELRQLRADYEEVNTIASIGRRLAPQLTSAQKSTLSNQRKSILDTFEKIDEKRERVARWRRVFNGEEHAQILEEELDAMLDELRGARPAAA
jgi:Zn-dependent M32 family carboxypeptidase